MNLPFRRIIVALWLPCFCIDPVVASSLTPIFNPISGHITSHRLPGVERFEQQVLNEKLVVAYTYLRQKSPDVWVRQFRQKLDSHVIDIIPLMNRFYMEWPVLLSLALQPGVEGAVGLSMMSLSSNRLLTPYERGVRKLWAWGKKNNHQTSSKTISELVRQFEVDRDTVYKVVRVHTITVRKEPIHYSRPSPEKNQSKLDEIQLHLIQLEQDLARAKSNAQTDQVVLLKNERDLYTQKLNLMWSDAPKTYRSYGHMVQAFRRRAGLSPNQLASKIGYTLSRINQIESGNRPSKELADRIAGVLGKPLRVGFVHFYPQALTRRPPTRPKRMLNTRTARLRPLSVKTVVAAIERLVKDRRPPYLSSLAIETGHPKTVIQSVIQNSPLLYAIIQLLESFSPNAPAREREGFLKKIKKAVVDAAQKKRLHTLRTEPLTVLVVAVAAWPAFGSLEDIQVLLRSWFNVSEDPYSAAIHGLYVGMGLLWAYVVGRVIQRFLERRQFSHMDFNALHQALQNPLSRKRVLAIVNLMKRKEGQMVTSDLLAMLERDASNGVRQEALHALVEMRTSSAVGVLLRVAMNDDDALRDDAVEALGTMGQPRAATPLVKFLGPDYGEDEVQNQAVYSLLQLHEPESLKKMGDIIEKELIERIRLSGEDQSIILDPLLEIYEEILEENEKPSGVVYESLGEVFARVNHPVAQRLLKNTLQLIQDDEDVAYYTTTSWQKIGSISIPIQSQHSRDADADETLELAAEDVLEVDEVAAARLEEMDGAIFKSLFGSLLAGHLDWMLEAMDDTEVRIPTLLAAGLTPEQIAEKVGIHPAPHARRTPPSSTPAFVPPLVLGKISALLPLPLFVASVTIITGILIYRTWRKTHPVSSPTNLTLRAV